MSRSGESGAYLGGIGAMLGVSNVCPACGQVHEGRKFGFKHRAPRECPLVIIGSFPLVSLPTPALEVPIRLDTTVLVPTKDARDEPETVLDGEFGPVHYPRARSTERTRSLGLPWLPPPDLGEVL